MKDHDEDQGLLESFDLTQSDEGFPSESQQKQGRGGFLNGPDLGPNRRWRQCRQALGGASVLVLVLIVTLLLASVAHEEKDTATSQLAILLHPEQHTSRKAETLNFDWHITRGLRAPDGVQKRVYLVNGEFPGPTIETRSGDRLVIHVHNELQDEGISLHWHGLRLKGHNRMDGAVGFTQCPIPSGGDMIYDFQIGDDEHGTFWWHGHDGVQRADGLFGGLVVHPPVEETSDMVDNDALLMVGDWFHQSQEDVLAWYDDARSLGREPVPDSLLINGHGRFDCSKAVPARPIVCQQIEVTELQPILRSRKGQSRLRVVNTGTIAGVSLNLDGAVIRLVRVDGSFPIDSRDSDAIGILYPGERVDFIVEFPEDHSQSDQWLEILLDDENFGMHNPSLIAEQAFPLFPETAVARRSSANWPQPEANILQAPTAAAEASAVIPPKAQETLVFYLKTQKLASLDNRPVGFINHTTWAPQNPPLLSQTRESWDEHQLMPFIGMKGSDPVRVDVVLNNLDDGSHPFHLHGNSFYVLSSYRSEGRNSWGSFDPFEESEPPNGINLKSPVRKDTVNVPRRGHVVLAIMVDNLGLWMIHCHMLVHMATGMGMGFHIGDADDYEHVSAQDVSAGAFCAQ